MAVDRNTELFRELRAGLEAGDFDRFVELVLSRAIDDFAEDYPQSGEVVRGRERIAAMNRAYPDATGTRPSIADGRLRAAGDLGVLEATIDYGDGTVVAWVAIAEARDGLLVRLTEYFAGPFDAPEWRRPYMVEG